MSYPDVFVNVRRAFVPLVAVRTLKSWLLAAIVLHVRHQRLLVGVTGVASGTVVLGDLVMLPEYRQSFLVIGLVLVVPQDVEYTGFAGR